MANGATSSIEPQSQPQQQATSNPLGQMGGMAPGGTTPTFPDPKSLADFQKIMELAKMMSSPARPVLPTPVPRQAPQQQPTGAGNVPGYMTKGPQWGFERFAQQVTPLIQNAFAKHKQQQIDKAEADWNVLQTGLQTGNQALIQSILGDPKKLKEMAKALNQDWMNPKNSTTLQGLNQMTQKQGMQAQQKASMLQRLKQMIMQRQQQPQLTPQQQQALTQEMMKKIGTAQQPPDLKTIMPLVTEFMKQQTETGKEEHQTQLEEMKEAHGTLLANLNNTSKESIESLKDLSAWNRMVKHDEDMFRIAGLKEGQAQAKQMKSEVNTQINSTLTSLRQQYNEANQQLKSQNTALSKKSWYQFWKDDPDVKGAQQKVDNLQGAINYIEKNRAGMISGKTDIDQVIDQATQMISGSGTNLSDLGGQKVQ